MPNILAVDCTGETLTVAVGRFALAAKPKKTDEALLPLVERLLKKAKLDWKDLDAVAAASGPGRFTGIRIGLSFAAAAGYGLGVPAFAVSRLDAAAAKAGKPKVLAALRGWKDEVSHQAFRGAKASAPPSWSAAADWESFAAASGAKGYPAALVEVGASDLLPVAERLLASKRRPPLEPLYLKPASYERPRA